MGGDFYTLQELADKLEVSIKTVQQMVDRGELKEGIDFYRIGRSLRFIKVSKVELTAEGVDAVAEAVIRKLVDRGFLSGTQDGFSAGAPRGPAIEPVHGATLLLPETGFLRVPDILKFIPVSRATWWLWVKDGRAPKGHKLSDKVTAWRAEDIRELIARIGTGKQ